MEIYRSQRLPTDFAEEAFFLLLSADPRNGVVRDTVPSIAQRCGLPVAELEKILTWLESADPYSRTPDSDGRRIERGPDGITLVTYLRHRDRDHSTARVQKFRAKKKGETERNAVSSVSETLETTDTDTDTDTEKETKNSSNNPKPEPEKAELRSESDSKNAEFNLNSAKGTRNRASRKNGAEDTARRYVAVLDAVSGRRTRKLSPDVVTAVKQRLKDWEPWQIVGVPLLVFAQGRRDKYSPDVFLRDGSHPRTRDGNTYGGFYWLSRTYENADGTRLDSRLTSIAEQSGVLDRLRSVGVITEATA